MLRKCRCSFPFSIITLLRIKPHKSLCTFLSCLFSCYMPAGISSRGKQRPEKWRSWGSYRAFQKGNWKWRGSHSPGGGWRRWSWNPRGKGFGRGLWIWGESRIWYGRHGPWRESQFFRSGFLKLRSWGGARRWSRPPIPAWKSKEEISSRRRSGPTLIHIQRSGGHLHRALPASARLIWANGPGVSK